MVVRLVISIVANAAGVWVAAKLLGGVDIASGIGPPLIAGAVLGIVNTLVRPVITLLALPVVILTLGLALLAINVLMVALAAWLVDDFRIDGVDSAIGAAIVIWVVNAVVDVAFGDAAKD